jgi:hypothetical protein
VGKVVEREMRGGGYVLAKSASRRSRMKPKSISSRALKTSAGLIVFLPAERVNSLALGVC